MEIQGTSRWPNQPHNFLKNEKNFTTKKRIKDEHKKNLFQKQKFQNQKDSTPTKNLQQYHNALTFQNTVNSCFKDAMIANSVELMNVNILNTSRWLN